MLVSVIMPVYNASEFLKESIQSLFDQTYTNWELIAVDDGSTDNSWDILQNYKERDARIKIFQRTNGGQCAATNTGLQYMKGDYVLFFDADDLMDKDKIKVQMEALKIAGTNTVAISKWAFFKSDIREAKFKEEPVYYSGKPSDWLFRLWAYETMMPNHGYLIPVGVIERAGKYYDENISLNVDFEYFTRIILSAEDVIYCPDSICYYRKGVANAKTTNPKIEKCLSSLHARRKAISYLLKKEKNEQSIYASRMAISMLTYSFPKILPYSKEVMKELNLGKFLQFGGKKFKALASIVGYENAVRIKGLLS